MISLVLTDRTGFGNGFVIWGLFSFFRLLRDVDTYLLKRVRTKDDIFFFAFLISSKLSKKLLFLDAIQKKSHLEKNWENISKDNIRCLINILSGQNTYFWPYVHSYISDQEIVPSRYIHKNVNLNLNPQLYPPCTNWMWIFKLILSAHSQIFHFMNRFFVFL